MLSRLYSRAAFRPGHLQLFGLSSRCATTTAVETTKPAAIEEDDFQPPVRLNSDSVPKPVPFYTAERDYVNFPDPVRREEPGVTRQLIFPEEWYQFLYKKTGVTGPYALGLGVVTFLVQKEFYLFDHDWTHTAVFFCYIYMATKSPISKLFAASEDEIYEEEKERFANLRKENESDRLKVIEIEKKEQYRLGGIQLLYQAKKENVGLQLEATYRENAINFYNQVKRRLDYQVEVAKIDARIKRQYMVEWTIMKVKEAITPEHEKQALKKCIADLDVLAARA